MVDYTPFKICTKCHIQKPANEFYRSRNSNDGLTAWCKACNKAHRIGNGYAGNRSYKLPTAESTALVRKVLYDNGIPSCTGIAVGVQKVDLMAWACVPVEAKIARQTRPNYFHWSFSSGQVAKLRGFVVFVADYVDRQRYFVIPVEEVQAVVNLTAKYNAFCLTLDGITNSKRWNHFKKFENRFDLITLARDLFV